MELIYISISVVGIIIFIASVFLLKYGKKKIILNLVVLIFSIIMVVLSVLVFLFR